MRLREAEFAEYEAEPAAPTSELRDPELSVARILRDL
jgi:hypothetical protein